MFALSDEYDATLRMAKLTIGLTGGIGSGKSTVAKLFAEQGIDVIDADQLAREVTKPHTPALDQIVQHFGKKILNDHQLDRKQLREVIFNDPKERTWLENLLHPLIRAAMKNKIEKVQSPYCILVIPLLIETKPHPLVKRILVVDVPESLQIKRAMERDQLSLEAVQAVLRSQVSRPQRLQAADDVITNDKDRASLQSQVLHLHERYLRLTHNN